MRVRVCDLRSDNFASSFIDSVVNTGFAVITRHGIDSSLIKDTQDVWRHFFSMPKSVKEVFLNKQDPNMGYKGFGQEKAVGAKKADLKEFFHWKPAQHIPTDAFYPTRKMFAQLEDISSQILAVIDSKSGTNYREACENSNNTLMRTLYYPAMDFSTQPDAVRAAAHQDINFITLLVAASASGLQVMDRRGKWHDVPHEENSIVVNIGDMLELASNKTYRSTTHRVINPENNGQDRISLPLFVHPHGSTLLVEGVTAQQYLDQRLKEIYLKG